MHIPKPFIPMGSETNGLFHTAYILSQRETVRPKVTNAFEELYQTVEEQ